MNFTLNGGYRSDNNLIRVRSSQVAENYLIEFEEMFLDHQFGSGSPANTPNPTLTVEGTEGEAYFSPDDGTIERLIELVGDAEDEILFMAFSFTDDDLAQVILDRAGEGIVVAGVFDKSQALSNTRNDENTLVIHDPEIAEFYREEFARVWRIAQKSQE